SQSIKSQCGTSLLEALVSLILVSIIVLGSAVAVTKIMRSQVQSTLQQSAVAGMRATLQRGGSICPNPSDEDEATAYTALTTTYSDSFNTSPNDYSGYEYTIPNGIALADGTQLDVQVACKQITETAVLDGDSSVDVTVYSPLLSVSDSALGGAVTVGASS
ncbi:MAG: hypothetical protein QM666_03870, partial [Acinetobacter sp.]